MTTAWSHLPNAAHIDRILADVKANPDDWARACLAARNRTWVAAWDAAWDATRDVALVAARDAAWPAALDAAWDAAWPAARSAILALIAWPEASDYLNLSVDSVRVLAALGDHKAALILPAAIVFDQQKEIT
jgi:hypothetical protein